MTTVDLGGVLVGDGRPVYVCAEIGINHNGDVDIARRLIDAAADAGAQAVKTQKRTVDVVYAPEELARLRESPWGKTNGDLKRRLELDRVTYEALANLARANGVALTASAWDEQALSDVCEWVRPSWLKIASAVLTWPPEVRDRLLTAYAHAAVPIVMSTGMCDLELVSQAMTHVREVWSRMVHLPDRREPGIILLACTSTYPCEDDEIHLRTIETLRREFGLPVGYSGHERGIATTVAAVALGACFVERHITLDRAMFGSDQSASLEPQGFARMVRDIRSVERAMGSPEKRRLPSEEPVAAKLRRVS